MKSFQYFVHAAWLSTLFGTDFYEYAAQTMLFQSQAFPTEKKSEKSRFCLAFYCKKGQRCSQKVRKRPGFKKAKLAHCCHSVLTSFFYNKNEKSLHFPTRAETKKCNYLWLHLASKHDILTPCIIKSSRSKLHV